jgi:hypothetical protein
MKLFHRRDAVPASVMNTLPKDERVVSWADTEAGAPVLATPSGLWWPEPGTPRLIGWQYIDKAVWHEGVLTVVQADVVDDIFLVDRAPVSVQLSVPRDLPPTVRKRVEGNIVRSELLGVAGGQARFVARRVPGRNGVRWWARLEPGTAETPELLAAVRARVALLRNAEDARQAQ